ncbi:hypothetical protein VPH35_029871 [Triticum aestivum]|uniref:DUF6598 domain-containing protein n=2 Tax=Triticum TaxID=4564 RepID=A0A9R1PSJ6_TRITD|nr:uncharacterized protein LOC123045779 [Triticum aestivum]VAH48841.1 unnamed protein product [Triticum turgidum subsp. durum]
MPLSVSAEPERACWSAVFCSLQACISEPIRFIHYGTLDVVRRLFFSRGVRERERARGTGTGEETANPADEQTGDKNSPAADDDYSEQLAEYGHNSDRYDGSNCGDYYDTDGDWSEIGGYEEYYRKDIPPSLKIGYDGDSINLSMAYSLSRDLVELLSVRPRFPFVGTFVAFNDRSHYYCNSENGPLHRNVDSQGNLILRAEGAALEDYVRIKVEIPEDDNRIDTANYVFYVDPYFCNNVIVHTMPTRYGRDIDVFFVPMYRAIQARLCVNLDLTSGSGCSYAYGEITAHHEFYGDFNVLLFQCGEDDMAEVVDGTLPLLRTWAAVPIYLEPLLIIKLNLSVFTNSDHVNDGHAISFQGDLTFYHDQYEKAICNADHGKVEVQIGYR